MKALLIASTAAATLLLSACGGEAEVAEDETLVGDTAGVMSDPLATTDGGGAWDTDNDGMLNQTEYTAWRERGFSDWDLDQDDQLTQDEFNTGWTEAGLNNGGGVFSEWDTNEDSFIGSDEWFSEEGWTNMDANTSGILENDELGGI